MMERVVGGFSLWPEERPELCNKGIERCGEARCVACDGGDWDVVECSKCGKQKKVRCTFDDDFA
ncbi:hypothetical protein [Caballeronia sp. DA-9]|uniref:hypothetical protein n=1 Tax=Caballeronia sp. DA-9 TaxID=3436237 RepID=UPI003F67D8E6